MSEAAEKNPQGNSFWSISWIVLKRNWFVVCILLYIIVDAVFDSETMYAAMISVPVGLGLLVREYKKVGDFPPR